MEMTISFGSFLRNLRKKRGLTMVELCTKSDISQPYLSQLENDKINNPSPPVLQKLADALGVPWTDMVMAAGYEVVTTDKVEQSFEEFQEIQHYLEQMMKKGRPTLNGRFISNVELKRLIDILPLMYPEYFE